MDFDYTLLREGRRSRKMKQSDVADILGCTPSTVSNIENGVVKVSAKRVAELAAIYDIPIEKLFIRGKAERHG